MEEKIAYNPNKSNLEEDLDVAKRDLMDDELEVKSELDPPYVHIPNFLIDAYMGDDGYLDPFDYLVFSKLLRHRNQKTNQCRPGYRRIKKETGVSLGKIVQAIAKFQKANFCRIETEKGQTNLYTFNHPHEWFVYDHNKHELLEIDVGTFLSLHAIQIEKITPDIMKNLLALGVSPHEHQKRQGVRGGVLLGVSPHERNNKEGQKERTKNIPPISPKGDLYSEQFEDIWKCFPEKIGKRKAFLAFKRAKLSEEDVAQLKDYLLRYPKEVERAKIYGFWMRQMQDPERIIRNRRFEDPIPHPTYENGKDLVWVDTIEEFKHAKEQGWDRKNNYNMLIKEVETDL